VSAPSIPISVDAAGVVRAAAQIASPNCDERPEGTTITLLVVHNISLPPGHFGGPGIVELFTNRLDPGPDAYYRTVAKLRVSAHFLIRRDGALMQFVPCARRAWHAGASAWRGRAHCNDFSIGVELEGADDVPYEAAQYVTLGRLTRALRRRYPLADVAGHSDIAPGRKTDPGPAFDWARFRRLAGLDTASRSREARQGPSNRAMRPRLERRTNSKVK
jgi:N-acetyl-anhydromuramoyl-L-alanine amidase